MIDVVSIYNQALSLVGERTTISSTTQVHPAVEVCNLWYPSVRDSILASAPWQSATAFQRLAVLAERDFLVDWVTTDPSPYWRFTYGQPGDLLRPRHLNTYAQFTPGTDSANRKVIWANAEDPILVYTKRQERPDLWDIGLQRAIVFGLAAHIAIKLTGKRERAIDSHALAMAIIMEARVNEANSQEHFLDYTPEVLVARGYSGATSSARYIYPYADFTVSGFENVG
jgi:hypothetical protein